MRRWLALLVVLATAGVAAGQNVMTCGNQTNFACATGADTITGDWVFAGLLDVTTGKLRVPNGTSAPGTCGVGDIFFDNDAAQGSRVKLCTATNTFTNIDEAGGGSVTWNGILNPSGNQALNMGSNTTGWTFGNATGAAVLFAVTDTTSNTGTGVLAEFFTASGSTVKPFHASAGGVSNGVEMNTSGVLQKIGSGSIIADNLVFGSDAQGDIALRGASAYGRLAIGGGSTFLRSNGTTAAWSGIGASDIGSGTLANVLVWNELHTSCNPTCALSFTPRVSTGATPTVTLVSNGIVMQPLTTCGGVNQYTISGATVTPCDPTNNPDILAHYER